MITELYGLRVPDRVTHQWQVEAALYVNDELRVTTPDASTKKEHFKRLIRALFPAEALLWHFMLDDIVDAYLDETRVIHWGPTSIGKSHMWAALLLADWLPAPKTSSTILASTSLEALEERVFGCMKQLYTAAQEANDGTLPGQIYKQPKGLFYEAGGKRTGIYCVGVKPGDTEQEIQKHIGKHPPRFRVALDEPQGMPWAIIRAQVNAASSGEYKFVAMGNPKSWVDTLGRISEPKGGRKAVSDQMPKYWRSTWYDALVIFHDGRLNPSVTHPEGPEAGLKQFPFMLSAARIAEVGETEGEDSPDFWTMMVGFVPPGGLTKVVCSESEFIANGATDEIVHWREAPTVYAGGDPAFGGGRDQFWVEFIEHGWDTYGNEILRHADGVDIKLELSRGNIEVQAAEKLWEVLQRRGVPLDRFALDSTAAQSEFVNALEREAGEGGVWRVDYSSRVSDLPVPGSALARREDGSERTCRHEYKDRPTELWMSYSAYVKCGHVRNVPVEVMHQMSSRAVVDTVKPMQIEPKDGQYESKIGGRSPDHADASAICFDMLRQKFGVVPSGTGKSLKVPGMDGDWERAVGSMHIGGPGERFISERDILDQMFNPRPMSNAPDIIVGDW